jgi:uncharacterized membrane protein YfcA
MVELILSSIIFAVLGFLAGLFGGVIGFGTAIILLPALVHFYGPVQAVPIMAVTATVANLSRIFLWWRDINWKVCLVYGLTATPAVALGANTLVSLNETLVQVMLGVFLILLIPIRRWMRKQHFVLQLWHMALVGAFIGYLTGIVATTGAINTPFFLAYGLTKGAFLGTEAASTLAVLFTKGIAFHNLGLLNMTALIQGLLIGSFVLVGALFSKRIVLTLSERQFLQLMELVMLVSGAVIIGMAFK